MKVIYNINGNKVVEHYDGVELISTTINGIDSFDEPILIGEEIDIETNFAKFTLCEDINGDIWGCHCGYNKGEFTTEWIRYDGKNIIEVSESLIDFYGSKYECIEYKDYSIEIVKHRDECFQPCINKNYITVSKLDGTVDSVCRHADTYNGNIETLEECIEIIDYWS